MKKFENRVVALEQQAVAAAQTIGPIILYDPATGPPSRQPEWPPVVVLIPDNRRDAGKTIKPN